jgi:hypothetical protein
MKIASLLSLTIAGGYFFRFSEFICAGLQILLPLKFAK